MGDSTRSFIVRELVDGILADLLKLPDIRLMIGTGMRQVPYEAVAYYWRLKDHSAFLDKIGVPHRRVQPRMTRDFLVEFDSAEEAAQAETTLRSARAADGVPLFDEVDNRGASLFVTLTYPHDIPAGFDITVNGTTYQDFDQDVVFVAIKNAHHDTLGYFMDTASTPDQAEQNLPLKTLHSRVLAHFNL